MLCAEQRTNESTSCSWPSLSQLELSEGKRLSPNFLLQTNHGKEMRRLKDASMKRCSSTIIWLKTTDRQKHFIALRRFEQQKDFALRHCFVSKRSLWQTDLHWQKITFPFSQMTFAKEKFAEFGWNEKIELLFGPDGSLLKRRSLPTSSSSGLRTGTAKRLKRVSFSVTRLFLSDSSQCRTVTSLFYVVWSTFCVSIGDEDEQPFLGESTRLVFATVVRRRVVQERCCSRWTRLSNKSMFVSRWLSGNTARVHSLLGEVVTVEEGIRRVFVCVGVPMSKSLCLGGAIR